MGMDLEKIRKRIAEMNGQIKKSSAIQLWKPQVGEYLIRALPWDDQPDGEPIKERSFYYVGEEKGFLAPSQFGKEDPIEELRMALFQGKKPEERALAKTLFPKVYGYLRIVDRNAEDLGVQIWKFGKMINMRLLGFFVDEDCGDFLDVLEGRDLKVKVTQVQGKKFLDFQVDYRTKQTPLHADAKKRDEWLDSIKNLDDLHSYAFKTKDQIDSIVNSWLNGDPKSSDDDNVGTSKGSSKTNEVDDLANELSNSSQKKEEKQTKVKKPSKKLEEELDDESPSSTSVDLDDAFADLMSDDD